MAGWPDKLLAIRHRADKIAFPWHVHDFRQLHLVLARSSAAIFVVTIAVRMAVFKQLLPVQGIQGFYKYNEQARIAWAMVSGHGFSSPWANTPLLPTAQQPPLYPWLLAGIFKLAGPYSYASLWIAEIFNVLFASLTAILIFKVGKEIFGATVGILAAWIWVFWLDVAVVCLRIWESSLPLSC